jgi:hypothetical protein
VFQNPYNYRDGVTRLYPTYRTEAHATQAAGFGGDAVGDTPPAGRRKRRRRASGEGAEEEEVVAVTPDRAVIEAAVKAAVEAEKVRLMGRIEELEGDVDAAQQQAEERHAAQERAHAQYVTLTQRELKGEKGRRAEAEAEVLRLKGLLQEEQKKLALHSTLAGAAGAAAGAEELNRAAKEMLRSSKGGADSVIDTLCASFAKNRHLLESSLQQMKNDHKATKNDAMKAAQRVEALEAQLREAHRQVSDLREAAAGGDGRGVVLPVRHVVDGPTATARQPGSTHRLPLAGAAAGPSASAALQLRPGPSALNIVPHRTGATTGGLGGIDGGGSFLNAAGHVHGGAGRGGAGVINDGGRFIVTGADGRGGRTRVLVPLVENSAAAPGAPGGGDKGSAKRSKGGRGAAAQEAAALQKWVSAAQNRVLSSSTPPEPGWSA